MISPIQRKPRQFVPENIQIQEWSDVQIYFEQLLQSEINNVNDLENWLQKRTELESVVGEDYRWKYVRQSCDTEDAEKEAALNGFIDKIMPHWMQISNQLNEKVSHSEFLDQLDKEKFKIYTRDLKNSLELFREENIPIMTEIDKLSNEYGKISGAMTVEHDGKTLTLQQAQKLLQFSDRGLRQEIFEKIQNRRFQDKEQLEDLFDKLLQLRHQIALNAGFDNFRDYMMKSLGRFDYGVKDCEDFHEAIAQVIVPIMKKINQDRSDVLKISPLKPYDMDVPVYGTEPLQPFETADELLQKSISTLEAVDTYFADCIRTMEVMNHLDLDSRIGKRPGGYNMPLPEIGVPFIFMNAAGTQSDVVTMLHEAGHAIHSFLTKDLTYDFEKNFGSEVAELASMSMELMTMDNWNQFYKDADLLKRAKREQMERVLSVLPWIAIIDSFQHWMYTHPTHTREERKSQWRKISERFSTGLINWKNYEHFLDFSWHRQLHIFEVPFYYIEYGIAQLGAIGVWKNYRENSDLAVENYKKALSLGGTVTLPEVYQAAGVPFDFSEKNISSLAELLEAEL
ncbi:MAG TPA: M3 family oligoendopeptidase [Chitinophagales bacterium]|nr:M3 family oligoendopeptidase [Chitinophagales bacterium]